MRYTSVAFLLAILLVSPILAATDIIIPIGVTIQPGQQASFPVKLANPAPSGGVYVTVTSSDNSIVGVSPATVLIRENQTTTFGYDVQIYGKAIGTASITASASNLSGDTETVQVGTVAAVPAITLPSGVAIAPGQLVGFQVTLTVAAPAAGVTVALASSDTTKAVISPGSVFIAAGAFSPAGQPQLTGIAAGSAAITAMATGYTPASRTVQVQQPQPLSLNFAPATLTLPGVGTGNLQLTLSSPAPAGGLTVSLSSSNPAAVTVPASVSFTANSSSVAVPVTGVAVGGSATITASAANVTGASANVSVSTGHDIVVPSGLSLSPGEQRRIPITLAKPAPPGGVFISLSTSDSSKVAINPTSVFIPENGLTASVQPLLTAGAFGSAVITASATDFTGDSEVVLVGNAFSLSPSNLTFNGNGATQNLSLNLSSPAPAAGLTFNLSSSNTGVATVPATISVAGFATSASIPVTSVGSGSAVIHASSLPAFGDTTANVSVMPPATINLPSGVTVPLGQSVTFPITLGTPAPGGLIVTLTSSDPSKLSVTPATVTFSAGATVPSSQPQVTGLNAGSATITATATGYTTASQTVQVVETMSFVPSSWTITGTSTQNLALTLSAPLPAALVVSLSSSNPGVASVPANVTINAGVLTVSVPVTGVTTGSATITASALNIPNATLSITVTPAGVTGTISLPANVKVAPSQPAPFPVTLSVPAPAGGVTVSLSSNDPSVTVTPSVFVPAGALIPMTQPQIVGVAFGTATISASAPGYTPASQSVQVGATLSFLPGSLTVAVGASGNLQLSLSAGAPPAGLTVNLVSSNPAAATVPLTVSFAPGATTANVAVAGIAVGSATITASTNFPTVPGASAGVTVNNPTTMPAIILPTGLTLLPGNQLRFAVTLSQMAPSGGVYVSLSVSDGSVVGLSPVTVLVPEGQTVARVQPALSGGNYGSVTLTASAPGYTDGTSRVVVGSPLGFSPPGLTIIGAGVSQNFILNLPSPAPAGGLTIILSSSNPSVATVPANVTFPGNVSSVYVPVTSVSAGTTTIHASAPPNFPDTTALVTVVPPVVINLPVGFNAPLGQATPFPITLGSPAPGGGVTVSLTSSDNTKIQVSPASVFIAGGQTTPATQPNLVAFNIGTIIIGATAPGYISAAQAVLATATVTFTPTSALINAPNTSLRVTLSLSSAAPPGTTGAGRCESPDPTTCSVTVALSSDNPNVANVQPSVSFFPDGSSQAIVQLPITAMGCGVTTIHAGAPPYIPDSTITIAVCSNPPTANAGSNQNATVGATIQLTGTGSDPQNLPLTFQWSLTVPAGSAAVLSSATAANPTFVADKVGTYTAKLVVSDGALSSAPSSVTISVAARAKPTAKAGLPQSVTAPVTVTLSGTGSSSVDNSPLTYSWTLTAIPTGSQAVLAGANTISPTFVADKPGTYTAQLIVNDGSNNSDPASVTIVATTVQAVPTSITATGGTPQSLFVNSALCAPLAATVKDANGVPVMGATVTFSAPVNGTSGVFSSGATATAVTDALGVATAPAFTANGANGAYTVTASVGGVAQVANFSLTNVFLTLTATSGMFQSTTVNSSFAAPLVATVTAGSGCGNPGSGVTVTFDASNANGTFPNGAITASAVTNSMGVATSPVFTANSIASNYTVTAFASGASAQVSFPLLNVPQLGAGGLTISSTSVGKNLEAAVTITLSQPAGLQGVQVNVASGDQSRLLVSGRSGDPGTGFVSRAVGISAGSTTTTIFVQGLDSTGSVLLTAFGNDGSSGTAPIFLTPSGFVLTGPNGNGFPGFSTGAGVNSLLTVTAARLDSSFNFVEPQSLRPGISASVSVTSSDTTVGTITASPLTFTPQNSVIPTQFNALGVGTAIITASGPPGFSTPAGTVNTNMLTANISSSSLTAGSAAVGYNLETITNVTLSGGAPTGGLTVTLTSNDPSKLLFSIAPDTLGLSTFSNQTALMIPATINHTRDFYVQALAGSGTVTYTAVAIRNSDGTFFGSSIGTITLTPSAIMIPGTNFVAVTGGNSTPITVQSVQLNGTTNPLQPVRGGVTVSATVGSSQTAVGTISPTQVTIVGGNSSTTTYFQPLAPGSTNLSVTAVPAGFVPGAGITATVAQQGISLPDAGTIGMNLETPGSVIIAQLAPAGGVSVTLTSGDKNQLLLSSAANVKGTPSITVVVPQGSNTVSFYLQAQVSSGSIGYTAKATGFTSGTGTANFGPSGVVLAGPIGFNSPYGPYSAKVGTAFTLSVYTALLNADGTFASQQQLAGGNTLSASLSVAPVGKGTLSPTQVTIQGGSGAGNSQYTPNVAGAVKISVATPGGYTPASNFTLLDVSAN